MVRLSKRRRLQFLPGSHKNRVPVLNVEFLDPLPVLELLAHADELNSGGVVALLLLQLVFEEGDGVVGLKGDFDGLVGLR
eukprot:CAMPEP_0170492362 /NCGR_PEP_ID=MMETSP0208-20121228/12123_1 /TAXON_ID=197538 /ORGANISM="Strombidium inclinatum, Strain S3" /LENGTH=79 /DNA_ID=CAMNT_0010768085 /DNA_START=459 /DNA_END=698 /DNA_ORIENTATION=-